LRQMVEARRRPVKAAEADRADDAGGLWAAGDQDDAETGSVTTVRADSKREKYA